MKDLAIIESFMARAREDARIGPLHVSLFTAFVFVGSAQGCGAYVEVSARRLMPVAKIFGLATYHRVIRQLYEYGYIRYEPSYNREVASRVYFVQWED